jgi:hypothetical protein
MGLGIASLILSIIGAIAGAASNAKNAFKQEKYQKQQQKAQEEQAKNDQRASRLTNLARILHGAEPQEQGGNVVSTPNVPGMDQNTVGNIFSSLGQGAMAMYGLQNQQNINTPVKQPSLGTATNPMAPNSAPRPNLWYKPSSEMKLDNWSTYVG